MKRRLGIHLEEWPMLHPFAITNWVFSSIKLVVVEIGDGEHVGRGEAAGVYYLDDTVEKCIDIIEELRDDIENGLDRHMLQSKLPPGGARNAVDCALWDLECKMDGETIWAKTGVRCAPQHTVATIGVLPHAADMAESARRLADYPLLKIKLDATDPIGRIRAIRDARPDARLFVDANQAFSMSQLEECVVEFQKCGVEMIEQPLARGADVDLENFSSAIPLCADESCLHSGELEAASRRYQMINIKLDKAGGLTEALHIVEAARSRGLKLMVGNMMGTSLAMVPALVVAQSCDLVDLDGPIWLRSDRFGGLSYTDHMVGSSKNGFWG